MGMKLPIYEMIIDDDPDSEIQMDFVSLVPNPAIKKNFHKFSAQSFKIQNEERQIISGPAMLADVPIYRFDPSIGEYYVVFSRDTVMSMVQKFFRKGFQNNINLFHDKDQMGGAVMFESFISDKSRGIMPMQGFEDANDGSWFVSMKVYDLNTWQRVKAGEFSGLSIEGIFQMKKEELSEEAQLAEQIKNILAKVATN
jgi:hypothetical protein